MAAIASGVYVLQALGVAYAFAGIWIGRSAAVRGGLFRPTAEIRSFSAALGGEPGMLKGVQPNVTREWWTVSGALLAMLAGAAMIACVRAAPILLSLLVLHHILFFARQEDASGGRGACVGREVSVRMAFGFALVSISAAATAALGALGGLR